MKQTVLIVDDEVDLRELFSQVIESSGFKTEVAANGHEAYELIQNNSYCAILTDIRMPMGDGAELLVKIKENYPNTPVYVMSGYNDFSSQDLLDMGAEKVYYKPFNYDEFIQALKQKVVKS